MSIIILFLVISVATKRHFIYFFFVLISQFSSSCQHIFSVRMQRQRKWVLSSCVIHIFFFFFHSNFCFIIYLELMENDILIQSRCRTFISRVLPNNILSFRSHRINKFFFVALFVYLVESIGLVNYVFRYFWYQHIFHRIAFLNEINRTL